ncbi:hypothetical protein TNCV_4099131 [Trichonephila clavipes]|nr:hypothetical protein TNCV_4099131 [Trichonephila clavipes]
MLEKVIENWTSRLDYIRASHGSPMPEIIFKMITDFLSRRASLNIAGSFICHRPRNRWPYTPTTGFDTCKPETPRVIQGVKKKPPNFKTMEWNGEFVGKHQRERSCCLLPLK